MAALQDILDKVNEIFTKDMPFMQQFSSSVERFDEKEISLRFEMSEKLVGNMVSRILHGGVIASMLDSVGGMVTMAAVSAKYFEQDTPEQLLKRIGRTSTVNLFINFMRPGRAANGEHFYAVAKMVRCGKRISVCELSLLNQDKKILATGTGTYMNGAGAI